MKKHSGLIIISVVAVFVYFALTYMDEKLQLHLPMNIILALMSGLIAGFVVMKKQNNAPGKTCQKKK